VISTTKQKDVFSSRLNCSKLLSVCCS